MLTVKHRNVGLVLCWLLFAGVVFCTVRPARAGTLTVTGITVTDGTGVLKIGINASGPVHHRAKTLVKPRKLIVVDVFPATLGKNVKTMFDVNRGLVEAVKVKQYSADTVRVYVDVISLPEYKVVTSDGGKGLVVAITTSSLAEGKAASTPATKKSVVKPVAKSGASRPKSNVGKVSTTPSSTSKYRRQEKPVSGVQKTLSFSGSGHTRSVLRKRRAPRRKARPKAKTVTLDFVNADLVYVIKVLAKELGKNVFVGPSVQGSVTVTLKNVPVEGALALILKMQDTDYDYKVVDNTIIVAPPEKLEMIPDDILSKTREPIVPEDAVRQEFILEKAPASQVIDFLSGQYARVKFTPHPTMNGFYAVGSKSDILQIKRELPNLDRVPEPPPPPLREFLPVKYGDVNEVRTLLATLVPDLQYNVDTRLNMLIVDGSPGAIDQVKELLAEIDKPLDQVMMDVKVVDLNENGRKSLGITWGAQGQAGTFQSTFQEAVTPQTIVNVPGGQQLSPQTAVTAAPGFTGLEISPFARSPFVFQANLQMLISEGEAKVLAAPRVAAQSGKDALIHIGDKFPIVYFDPRAGQFQVQYVDIGIKLDVHPDVKSDGYIVVDLRPEVSTLVELVNNQYPRTAVRTVNTTMRIKDGDTITIGGLINENDIETVQKIPLLGDLPIVGTLFRSVSVQKSRNEVVMMLSTYIMR